MEEKNTVKWFNKSWVVILFSLTLFPINLFVLWKNQTFKKVWKILLGLLSPISTIISLIIILATLKIFNSKESQYFKKGQEFEDAKNYHAAVISYGKTTEINPKNTEALYKTGKCLIALNEFKGAIINLTLAIEYDRDNNKTNIDAYYYRGVAFSNIAEYENAISDFNIVIENNPKYSDVFYRRGIAKSYLNRHSGAILDFNSGLETNPKDVRILEKRAVEKMLLNQFDLAVADYNTIINIEPNNFDALVFRGKLTSPFFTKRNTCGCKDLFKVEKIEPLNKLLQGDTRIYLYDCKKNYLNQLDCIQ